MMPVIVDFKELTPMQLCDKKEINNLKDPERVNKK